MKKIKNLLLLAAGILLGSAAQAQSSSVIVTNHSSCTVYYQLRGDHSPCGAGSKRIGAVPILPGASITYSNPTTVPIPTLGPTDYITGARIYSRSTTACTSITLTWIDVTVACAGAPTSDTILSINESSCTPCAPVNAVWTAGTPLTPNALDFY
jgi:hypothetical protein